MALLSHPRTFLTCRWQPLIELLVARPPVNLSAGVVRPRLCITTLQGARIDEVPKTAATSRRVAELKSQTFSRDFSAFGGGF